MGSIALKVLTRLTPIDRVEWWNGAAAVVFMAFGNQRRRNGFFQLLLAYQKNVFRIPIYGYALLFCTQNS